MKDFAQELLSVFQAEHKEHLERLRALLADWEKGGPPEDPGLEEALRRAHSLKGAARAVDLRMVEKLAHRLETLLSRAREGTLPLDKPILGIIHLTLDSTEDWVSCLAENRAPAEPDRALRELDRVLNLAPEPMPEAAAAAPAGFKPVETVRLAAGRLDGLLRSAGELLTENLRQDRVTGELGRLAGEIAEMAQEWESLRRLSASALSRLAEEPGLAPVARYLDGVERRVRALTDLARQTRQLQRQSSRTLSLLGSQLREDVRQARLAPAQSVFEGFARMMRELARDEGKEIQFEAVGMETEADRKVLQALKDPLTHLLRNAATHGIEPPEERRSMGKNPAGRVILRLEARGNRLEAAVEDDGRGIDFKAAAGAAAAKGLVPGKEALSPEDISRLLFKPGLTTSRSVTELSGRGMGLAIVREAALRLQGTVEFRLQKTGACVAISVPLSISTHRLLLVSCRGQILGIAAHAVERLLRVKISDLETMEARPVVRLEGRPITLVSLSSLLRLGEGGVEAQAQVLSLAILRSGDKRLAVAVDALLGVREGLVLEAPALPGGRQRGAVILEDGSVALVPGPAELFEAASLATQEPVLKTEEAPAPARFPSILVVDDSITTRALEKGILEANGYQVRVAVDGEEALAQLRSGTPDLVIADVKMPRRDGFSLIEEMKKDQGLAKVPVILVTSMESREDQEKGLALGAEAYIIKRKFDQRELLETVRQLI